MSRRTKIIAIGLAALVLGAGAVAAAGYVAAQEPTPGAPKRERLDAYLDKAAANLGVTTDELRQAFRDAGTATVDELVADGTLTPEQGAAMKEKIATSDDIGLGFLHRRHDRKQHGRGEGLGQFQKLLRGGIIATSAEAIGITTDELTAEMRAGQSIAEVAGANGVNLDAVKAAITDKAKARFDEAVANGRIDQGKADEMLANLSAKLDEVLNKKKEPEAAPTG